MMTRHCLFPVSVFIALLLSFAPLSAQQSSVQSTNQGGGTYTFSLNENVLPELEPLPGFEETPYYHIFWEFGDGHFAYGNPVTHTFDNDGIFEVRAKSTPIYSDQGDPPIQRKSVNVGQFSQFVRDSVLGNDLVKLFPNWSASVVPDDHVTAALVFTGDPKQAFTGGTIEFQYDKSMMRMQSLDGVEDWRRIYEADAIIYDSQGKVNGNPTYNAFERFEVDDVPSNREWSIILDFITLEELPEGETELPLKAIWTTNSGVTQIYELRIPIGTVHDPNDMQAIPDFIIRGSGPKTAQYKIRFQNEGSALANNIYITTKVPQGLDISSFQFLDFAPGVLKKAGLKENTSDELFFVIENARLPGLNMEGLDDITATQGFVEYRIMAENYDGLDHITTEADIVFETEAPITTEKESIFIVDPPNGNGNAKSFGDQVLDILKNCGTLTWILIGIIALLLILLLICLFRKKP
ncbi:MAG: hypothetical protein AAF206_07975 [Bacteroidota bacterium]